MECLTFHQKKNKKTPNNNKDKWVPDKDVIDQINEYGIPEDFANSPD